MNTKCHITSFKGWVVLSFRTEGKLVTLLLPEREAQATALALAHVANDPDGAAACACQECAQAQIRAAKILRNKSTDKTINH